MDDRFVTPIRGAIRGRRKAKGWNQETLAAQSDVGKRTIERVEKGESVRLETINSIASALECQPSDLTELGLEQLTSRSVLIGSPRTIDSVLHHKQLGPITPYALADRILTDPGKKVVVSGRAGMGKTSLLQFIADVGNHHNIKTFLLPLDVYYRYRSLDAFRAAYRLTSEVLLLDGVDLLYYTHAQESQGLMSVQQFIADCASSEHPICMTVRAEFLNENIPSPMLHSFERVSIEPWTDEILKRVLATANVPMPSLQNTELLSLLRTPFYANLYMNGVSLEPSLHPTGFQLIEALIQSEVVRATRYDRCSQQEYYQFLDRCVWWMRQHKRYVIGDREFLGLYETVFGHRESGLSIPGLVELFRHTSYGYAFSHELIAEALVSRRLIDQLREGKGAILSTFQTSYYEDTFVAEEADRDSAITDTLRELASTAGKEGGVSDLAVVNAIGILAKMKCHDDLGKLLKVFAENPAVNRLYSDAVLRRVAHVQDSVAGQSKRDVDRGAQLVSEIVNGRDPIAALICLQGLSDTATDGEVRKALVVLSQKYGPEVKELLRKHALE